MQIDMVGRARLALGVAALTVPLLLVAPAWGDVPVTCSLVAAGPTGPAGDVLKVIDRAASVTHIYREGDEVVVFNNLDSARTACAGGTPTVLNIDRIEYSTSVGTPFLGYLGSGALAPGASPEAGAAEIEVSISESYDPKVLNVAGTAAAERIEVGQLGRGAVGVNLNAQADASAQDADVTLIAPKGAEVSLRAVAKGGNDTVSALGGSAFTGPIAAERLSLTGGAGNDRLLGGPGNEFLYGEDGNDLLLGGRGRDRLAIGAGRDLAKGGKGSDQIENRDWASGDDLSPDRVLGGPGNDNIDVAQGLAGDRVDCGSGVDRLAIDPGDQTKTCEDVDTIHR
jgi:RTX calcium-binding nonapeptide repeat (4 copies)